MTKQDTTLFVRTYKAFFKKHKKPSSLAEFAKYVLKHAHQFSKITVKRAGEFILGKSKHENKSIAASVALGNPKQYPNQGVVTSTFSRMVQAPSPPLPAPTPILLPPREDLTLTARDYIKKEPTHTPPPLPTPRRHRAFTPRRISISEVTKSPTKPTRKAPARVISKEGLMKVKTLKELREIFLAEGAPAEEVSKLKKMEDKESAIEMFFKFVDDKRKTASSAEEDDDEVSIADIRVEAAGGGRRRSDTDFGTPPQSFQEAHSTDISEFGDGVARVQPQHRFEDSAAAVVPHSHWENAEEFRRQFNDDFEGSPSSKTVTSFRARNLSFNSPLMKKAKEVVQSLHRPPPPPQTAPPPRRSIPGIPLTLPRPGGRLEPRSLFTQAMQESGKKGPG